PEIRRQSSNGRHPQRAARPASAHTPRRRSKRRTQGEVRACGQGDSSMSGVALVIEDDEAIGALVGAYLEQAGFVVVRECTAECGLESAVERQPRVVVLDLGLPDVDGFELCRRLRGQADVPILILTARDEETDRIVGLELGADDYVTKPFSPRELVARVRAV